MPPWRVARSGASVHDHRYGNGAALHLPGRTCCCSCKQVVILLLLQGRRQGSKQHISQALKGRVSQVACRHQQAHSCAGSIAVAS